MERRAFLTALGVASYGGLAWLIEACSSESTQPNRLGDSPVPSSTGTTTSPTGSSTPKTPPNDGNEYVPGGPADGGAVVDQSTQLPNKNWESRAKQLEASGNIYTEAAPGPWAGKERSHVPTIVADTMMKNRVTVLVNHVMQKATLVDGGVPDAGDAGEDADAAPVQVTTPEHYVTTIYVRTDTGVVAGLVEFSSSDASPPSVTFVLPAGTKSVTAYENCNIHGLWASKPLAVGA